MVRNRLGKNDEAHEITNLEEMAKGREKEKARAEREKAKKKN